LSDCMDSILTWFQIAISFLCHLRTFSDHGDSWTIVCAACSPRMRLNNNANIASPTSTLSSRLSIIVSTKSRKHSDLD
jgi:hypothetical protein